MSIHNLFKFEDQQSLNPETKQIFSRQLNKQTFSEKELLNIFNIRVLLVNVSSNCSEVLKNLVKNGVKTIYLSDQTLIQERDLRSMYFLNETDIGKPKDLTVQKHFPSNVQILSATEMEANKLNALNLNCIVVTSMVSWKQIKLYSDLALQLKIPFIFSCCLGLSFFVFSCFSSNQSTLNEDNSIKHLSFDHYFSSETTEDDIENIKSYNENHLENFVLICAILEYSKKFNRIPRLLDEGDSEELIELLNDIAQQYEMEFSITNEVYLQFAKTCSLEIPIIAEVSGALTACEVIKTVICRFKPASQVIFWDDFQLYPYLQKSEELSKIQPEFFNYSALFGENMMKDIANLKILLVGCGAVGCEQIKNLYQLGACRGNEGHLFLVDDDLIEKSNIPRQVLFTEDDVKKSKSETCKNWLKKKDKDMKVSSYQILLEKKNEDIFNYNFFEQLDFIIIAVDSVDGRDYIADKARKHKKFLIESGTQGFKADSQSQIPYFSPKIKLPPKVEINTAACTSKSALKNVGDSLVYAKSIFTNEFSLLREADGEFLPQNTLNSLKDFFVMNSGNIQVCEIKLMDTVKEIFNQMFYTDVLEIGSSYNPFQYSQQNPDHIEFADSLFHILKLVLLQSINNQPKTTLIQKQDVCQFLPSLDKDNILHGNLLYQISKLRSEAFNIPYNLERYEAIGQIGNIIPAILQSTSVASGFALLELFPWLIHKERINDLYQQVISLNKQAKLNWKNQNGEQEPQIKSNRNDLFLSLENYESIEQQFNDFGFFDTFGNTSWPLSLGKSQILFELSYLNTFQLNLKAETPFTQIIVDIKSLLQEHFLPQPYIIKLSSEVIYRQDAETTPLVNIRTKKKLESYLSKMFKEIAETALFSKTNDSTFLITVFTFKLYNNLQEGDKIAEIYLTLL